MSNLAAAVELARLGFRVFPLWPGAKNPITSSGFHDAVTDEAQIKRWWNKHPTANIGIATGLTATGERLVVIDLDQKPGEADGVEAWAEIAARHEPFDTVEALTATGNGRHLYFYVSATVTNAADANLPAGIDVRGEGGYVVAPPSVFKGGHYLWEASSDPTEGAEIAEAPDWLMEILTRTPPQRDSNSDRRERKSGIGNRPGDRWMRRTTWDELLGADGHRYLKTHTYLGTEYPDAYGTTYETWARSGVDHASATLFFGDTDVLLPKSTNWPLLTAGESYTKLGYVAATRFGNDMSAAIAWVRAEELKMMPAGEFDEDDPFGSNLRAAPQTVVLSSVGEFQPPMLDVPAVTAVPQLDDWGMPIRPVQLLTAEEIAAAAETQWRDRVMGMLGGGGDGGEPPTTDAPASDGEEPDDGGQPTGTSRLRVVINGVDQPDLVGEIVDAVATANRRNPQLFLRGGLVTRLRANETQHHIVETVDAERFRSDASKVVAFARESKSGPTPCFLPIDIARACLAERNLPFPPLVGITESPVLRPDGTFQTRHGYDSQTGMYLWSPAGDFPDVPDAPSDEQLENAVKLILDVFADFPFDTTSDFANLVGLLFTPMVRQLVPQTQCAMIDAPDPGTGKTLLASIVSLITTGSATMQPMPNTDDEIEKRIASLYLAGETVFIWDNVDDSIGSPVFSYAITAATWSGRQLGSSTQLKFPNRVTWIATGNNIKVSKDMGRRSFRIRLDTHAARPELRSSFKHPDLKDYVTDNRRELVGAMMTIVRSWWIAGCPQGSSEQSGEFAKWIRIVSGILEHIDVHGFLANSKEFRETSDVTMDEWSTFKEAWHNCLGDRFLTTNEVVRMMQSTSGDSVSDLGDLLPSSLAGFRDSPKLNGRLGMALSQQVSRTGDAMIVVRGPRNRLKQWTYAIMPADASYSPPAELDLEDGATSADQVPDLPTQW